MDSISKFCTIYFLFLLPIHLIGQTESPWNDKPEIEISGYLDVFYCYDFNQPTTKYRQPFFYTTTGTTSLMLNNAMIGLQ